MKSFLNIDTKTRFLVLYLDAGMKATRMSKVLKVASSTLYRWIEETENDQDIRKTKPGRGPKPKIDSNLSKKIQREIHEAPQCASLRKLESKFGVSKSSMGEFMHEKGYNYKKCHAKRTLEEDEKDDRMDYCEYMLEDGGWRIDQTIFTDEMGIKLSEAHAPMSWGKPNKKIKVEKPKYDMRLNCWGGISINGATSLHIFKPNLTSDLYENILEEHLPEMEELYSEDFFLQHDNLPAHKSAEEWIENEGLERVDFPSYSADWSPIENLWSALKHSVSVEHPTTAAELEQSLRNNWKILTTRENLAPYFDNLHSRYADCIEVEGEELPY